jgi:hypothetical protein
MSLLKGAKMNKFLHFNVNLAPSTSKAFKRKYQSRTVAVEPLNSDNVLLLAEAYLAKNASQEIFAHVNIGVTFLSFKDKYNRETGRLEAIKKQKLEKLKVSGVVVNNTHIYVNLENYRGIQLNLRTNKASGYSTVTGDLAGS